MKNLMKLPVLIIFLVFLASCHKDEEKLKKEKLSTEEIKVDDESMIEKDQAFLNELAIDLFSNDSTSTHSNQRVTASSSNVCGATVTQQKLNTHEEITLTFDGKVLCIDKDTCVREGTVKLDLILTKGGTWRDKGALITMTFHNYTVSIGSKSCQEYRCVTMTGTKRLTNLTGGLLTNLAIGDSIIHRVEGFNIKVNYGNRNQDAFWSVSRKKTFKKVDANNMIYRIEADGNIPGRPNTILYGIDRFGENFSVDVLSPLIQKTCPTRVRNVWRPTSGVKKLTTSAANVFFTYGVDSNGNLVDDCNAYGYKVNWNTLGGRLVEKINKY